MYDVNTSSALYSEEKVAAPKTMEGKFRGPNLSCTVIKLCDSLRKEEERERGEERPRDAPHQCDACDGLVLFGVRNVLNRGHWKHGLRGIEMFNHIEQDQ